MDRQVEQPVSLSRFTSEDLSLVQEGAVIVRIDNDRRVIDWNRNPNWDIGTVAINPGETDQEKRLLLEFENAQSGERLDFRRISSSDLEVVYDAKLGVLVAKLAAGNYLALRVAVSSAIWPKEQAVLEGILGLLTLNENYQLRGDPQQVLQQMPRVKKLLWPGLSPAAVSESVVPAPAAVPREAALKAEVRSKTECRLMKIDGRAGEDRVVAFNPGENPWGIYFLGGVFDGHSPDGSAGSLAENALPVFWQSLQKSGERNLEAAIASAAAQANGDLIRRFGAFEAGVCFEMVLWTREGLYLLHLGDGQDFWRKPKEVESLNFVPHHPPDSGKVAGALAVNRSWGDQSIRQIVGEKALSPLPDIRFLSWGQLKKQGITALLLTTDGLLDRRLKDGGLAVEAVTSGLSQAFQSAVGQEMQAANSLIAERNRDKPEDGQEAPTDDVSGLFLSW